ncbi:MAG TPA: ABC transporter ATP-binding protein [Gemmatimonadales bacterium]|nr:ABC transporter ATP-binding protein [Gemmatimonadales bacterium]
MRALRRLWPYLRRYPGPYLLGFVTMLASNLFGTLGPRYVQRGIDALGPGGSADTVRAAALTVLGLAVAGGVLRFGMRQWLNGASRRVETDLRDDLFTRLVRLPAAYHLRHPVGDLMARATNDLLALRMVAGPAIMYLVDTTVRTLMILPMMAAISPSLTLWALLPVLGLPAVMLVLGGEVHRRSRAVQDQFGEVTSFVQEHLAGIRVVRAYAQETAEERLFAGLDAGYVDRNLRLARAQGVFHPLLTYLAGLGAVVALLLGGRAVFRGEITVGGYVAFGVYLATLVWPMIALGWAISLLQRGNAAAERLDDILEVTPDIADPAQPATLPPAGGPRRVTFDGVWFRYPGTERGWVLEDLSFDVPAGTRLGIVGATGAGKSTIAELLVRSFDPDRGRILLDGVDIRTLRLAELRAAIAMVPQETFLFSATLRDNVLLGAPDDGRAEAAAQVSRLDAAIPDLPKGWDTMLGERGINLSGGQRQRTAIARALVRDPAVLVLDDALSAVDAETEQRILEALADATRGRTCLIATHRFSVIRDAEMILVLEGGRIVERGTHDELVARGGRYTELLERQSLEEELAS